ncbi:MAG: hypothetical protein ACK5PQ_00085 [Alphaproteobacteria bacterium]
MTLKKFALLVLITACGQAVSFSAALNLDDVVARWNNEEEMKPYFTALSAFKKVLDVNIKKQDPKSRGQSVTSPFTGQVIPFPLFSHGRSASHIFLKIGGSNEEPLFSELWTPFGKMDIFYGGAEVKKKRLAKLFSMR